MEAGDARRSGFPRPCGKYELLERIGTGGMAEVFRARLPGAGGFEKIVVIKRILPHLASRKQVVRMFVAEARLTALVQHKNIVQVFELVELEDGEFIMVMEYINGTDLRRLLGSAARSSLRVPPWFSVHMLVEVLDGLALAHELTDEQGLPRNIVHRDVTPSNIFVSHAGEIKLGDFGIAKDAREHTLTQTGQLKGKVPYMSPEQLYGEDLDQRADVFAAGVVLWECLTQRRLFGGRPDIGAMKLICEGERKPPSKYIGDIPPELDACVLAALEPDRETRTSSSRELQQQLVEVLPQLQPSIRTQAVRSVVKTLLREASGEAASKEVTELDIQTDHPFSDPEYGVEGTPTGTPTARSPASRSPASSATQVGPTALDLSFEQSGVIGQKNDPNAQRGERWLMTGAEAHLVDARKIPEFSSAHWAAHGLSDDKYEGANPFWLETNQGKELGPCCLDQVMIVIKAEAQLRLGLSEKISADRESAIDIATFAELTGQDGLTYDGSERLPQKGALMGFLDQRTVVSVLSELSRERLTGRLSIVPEGIRPPPYREIHVMSGAPYYVFASEESMQLPELLIQKKLIHRGALPELIHKAVRERKRLEAIVPGQVGTAQKLRTMLMKERLLEALRWNSGRFVFSNLPGKITPAVATNPFARSFMALLPELVHRSLTTDELRSGLAPVLNAKIEPSSWFEPGLVELGLTEAQRDVAMRLTKGKKLSSLIKAYPEEERTLLLITYLLVETDLVLRPKDA